nr:hypothetical protein Iba_chr11dCG5520 [Ipomoea batatas]GMD56741.1 hypothetical protein Iba_chr11eCG6050 [Ipomoea batatas]
MIHGRKNLQQWPELSFQVPSRQLKEPVHHVARRILLHHAEKALALF